MRPLETGRSATAAGRSFWKCDMKLVPLLRRDSTIDLAPDIYRQRLVVEGVPAFPISDKQIASYLKSLSRVCAMTVLIEPVTHRSDRFGWAGWIHWETSGAHFYAWEEPRLFFSVDIYTCKEFDPGVVIEFTRKYFDASRISSKEF